MSNSLFFFFLNLKQFELDFPSLIIKQALIDPLIIVVIVTRTYGPCKPIKTVKCPVLQTWPDLLGSPWCLKIVTCFKQFSCFLTLATLTSALVFLPPSCCDIFPLSLEDGHGPLASLQVCHCSWALDISVSFCFKSQRIREPKQIPVHLLRLLVLHGLMLCFLVPVP